MVVQKGAAKNVADEYQSQTLRPRCINGEISRYWEMVTDIAIVFGHTRNEVRPTVGPDSDDRSDNGTGLAH